MAEASKSSRSIFAGNIPYQLSEEQITDIFRSVGNVLSFRLVLDAETGRSKGYGFVEYEDVDSAASAVRNLNGHDIMGRELRVDFSHPGGKDTQQQQQQQQQSEQPTMPPKTNLPPLPAGVDLPPHLSCPDAISKTLSSLPPPQLLDILSQMKGLVMGDPTRATELLTQAPHLSYAMFQALLLMGLVDTSVLASVVETQSNTAKLPQPPPIQQPQHSLVQPPGPPLPHNFPPPQQPTPVPPHFQQFPGVQGQMNMPTPPTHNAPFQPPAPPPPQQNPQEDLIKQVLAMTQQQIDSLPPNERAQIMALRQQLTGRY